MSGYWLRIGLWPEWSSSLLSPIGSCRLWTCNCFYFLHCYCPSQPGRCWTLVSFLLPLSLSFLGEGCFLFCYSALSKIVECKCFAFLFWELGSSMWLVHICAAANLSAFWCSSVVRKLSSVGDVGLRRACELAKIHHLIVLTNRRQVGQLSQHKLHGFLTALGIGVNS